MTFARSCFCTVTPNILTTHKHSILDQICTPNLLQTFKRCSWNCFKLYAWESEMSDIIFVWRTVASGGRRQCLRARLFSNTQVARAEVADRYLQYIYSRQRKWLASSVILLSFVIYLIRILTVSRFSQAHNQFSHKVS
jgi:hypothetical protein